MTLVMTVVVICTGLIVPLVLDGMPRRKVRLKMFRLRNTTHTRCQRSSLGDSLDVEP